MEALYGNGNGDEVVDGNGELVVNETANNKKTKYFFDKGEPHREHDRRKLIVFLTYAHYFPCHKRINKLKRIVLKLCNMLG